MMTDLKSCINKDCPSNTSSFLNYECNLKEIELDEEGKCEYYKKMLRIKAGLEK